MNENGGPRNHPMCRSCGTPLRHTFVDLGLSPLANSYVKGEQLNRGELFYPLHVYICRNCLLVQVEVFETPKQIFSDYAYFSSYSETWLQHARTYVDRVTERFGLGPESHVVELASNDGYLLQYFVKKGIPVLGIEPAVNVAKAAIEKGVPTLMQFFGSDMARQLALENKKADLLIGNNVLAHVPDLNDFVRGMKIVLQPHGVITMEFPHLMRLVEENQFDTIYHEHFSYFSFHTVRHVFSERGLVIFDVEELPTHGGSLRIYARHAEDDTKPITSAVCSLASREESVGYTSLGHYLSFEEKVKETKRHLLAFLVAAKDSGKKIVAYGAAAKGNTLLNYCGIRTDFIDYVVDRSPQKQGLFLPGTHIPILPPSEIEKTRPDYLLILPWNLKDEVMQQMNHIRSWGGQFVVPIPEVRVCP
ncbi:MAG: class I SAM-dependent methyltransferase [Acidobacteriota bacterium]